MLDRLSEQHNKRFDLFEVVESTNDTLRDEKYHHGDAVLALFQTKGRGQKGNSWSSDKDQNLTFSLMLEPTHIKAEKQFIISKAVALGIYDALKHYGIEARIKWPNDIYVDNRKICGVLIENDVMGTTLLRSIVGIGINVNQSQFPSMDVNPTSMQLEIGRELNCGEVFGILYSSIMKRYDSLINSDIDEQYLEKLFRYNQEHLFRCGGKTFNATIKGIGEHGELLLLTDEGTKSFQFKEVEHVI